MLPGSAPASTLYREWSFMDVSLTREFADNSTDECTCRRCCDLLVSEMTCQRNVLSENWFVSENVQLPSTGLHLLIPCDIWCGTCSWPKWQRRNLWWWKRTAWCQYLRQLAPTRRNSPSPAGQLRTDRPHTPAVAKFIIVHSIDDSMNCVFMSQLRLFVWNFTVMCITVCSL